MSIGSLFLGFIAMLGITLLSGCAKEVLDVQEVFPFEVKVMPVPKEIGMGETVEIRFSIISNGNYTGNTLPDTLFSERWTGHFKLFRL